MRLALQWLAFSSMAASAGAVNASDVADGIDTALATAEYAFSETDWAGLQGSCEPVRAWATQAAKEALGLVYGEAEKLARSMCTGKNSTMCTGGCTYCTTDSNCWPMVDLDNPCHQLAVKALVAGVNAGGQVAKAMVDAGVWEAGKCSEKNTSEVCMGGLGLFCDWCEKDTTAACFTTGSALNPCLREEMLILAADAGSAVASSVSDAAKAKWADQKTFCATWNGKQSNCSAEVQCTWCGTAGTAVVNVCYFMGDTENKCMKATIQPYIDAAGKVKPIAEWVGSTAAQGYQNIKKWGNDLCGQYTDKASCDADTKCYFCGDDSMCYVFGSVNSPCGNYQKTTSEMKASWDNFWGNDPGCAVSLTAAHEQMKSAVNMAMSNLNATCKEFVKTEVYASRSMAALQKDLGNAKDAASALAGTQVARAKQSAIDAFNARNESTLQADALAAFEAANPCSTEVTTSASQMGFGHLGMPVVMLLFIILG